MSYSESEPDFPNSLSTLAPIFSESKSEPNCSESDFSSVYESRHLCFFTLHLQCPK